MAQNDIDVNVKVDGASVANQANAASSELNAVVKKHRDQLGIAVSRLTTFGARLGGLSGALNRTISTFMGTGGLIGAAGLVAAALNKLCDHFEEAAERIRQNNETIAIMFGQKYSDRMTDMRRAISEGRWTQSDEDLIASEKERALDDENQLRMMRDQLLKNIQNTPWDKGRGIVRTFQQYGKQDVIQGLADQAANNNTTLESEVQKWISTELSSARSRLREIEGVENELVKQKQKMADSEERMRLERERDLENELEQNERLRQKEEAFREKQMEERERALQQELDAGEKLRQMEDNFREKQNEEMENAARKAAYDAFRLPQMTSLSNKGIYMGETTNATIADPTFQMQKNIWNSVQGIQQLLR